MFKILGILKNLHGTRIIPTQTRSVSYSDVNLYFKKREKIDPLGWFLLLIPTSTFALGTWQVQRKKWKEDLLMNLKTQSNKDPEELPTSLDKIEQLEYCPVRVRGHFLHDKEIYLGPRSLIQGGDAATTSSLFSQAETKTHGYLVITPFKLINREETILVNRGWVPHKQKDPKTRLAGQIKNDVTLVGIVRLHESRPVFMPANQPGTNSLLYRDLEQMCNMTGAAPIFIDATDDFNVTGGPIGGQTRITLRNEHLSYSLTWFSLCAISSFMWYSKFIKGVIL